METFDTVKFMKNVGKSLGSGIKYEILGNWQNADYNKPHQIFHFEWYTNCMTIDVISEKEVVLPMIRNNREAMFAAIFIADMVDMKCHEKIKLYGSLDDFKRFTLTVQPYTDYMNDNDEYYYDSLAFKGLSTGKDVDDLEDVFNNLKI